MILDGARPPFFNAETVSDVLTVVRMLVRVPDHETGKARLWCSSGLGALASVLETKRPVIPH